MSSLKLVWDAFWADETGLVLSAEAVTVGTVGVLSAVVGLNAVGSALDAEMRETALAIRSLDQSYVYAGHRGCGAWTAGSYYIQPNVEQSVTEIAPDAEPELKAIKKRIDDERKAFAQPANQIRLPADQKPIEPTPASQPEPKPNQIPVPEQKPVEPGPDAPKA